MSTIVLSHTHQQIVAAICYAAHFIRAQDINLYAQLLLSANCAAFSDDYRGEVADPGSLKIIKTEVLLAAVSQMTLEDRLKVVRTLSHQLGSCNDWKFHSEYATDPLQMLLDKVEADLADAHLSTYGCKADGGFLYVEDYPFRKFMAVPSTRHPKSMKACNAKWTKKHSPRVLGTLFTSMLNAA